MLTFGRLTAKICCPEVHRCWMITLGTMCRKNPEICRVRAGWRPSTKLGGHGYAVVRVSNDDLETEFVCIERHDDQLDSVSKTTNTLSW